MQENQKCCYLKETRKETECNIFVNWKLLQKVNEIVYLGYFPLLCRDGRYVMDVERSIAASNIIKSALAT